MTHGKTIQCGRKGFLITLSIGLFALWYAAGSAYAADYTWDDGGPDSNWSTAGNWSPDGTPGAGDNAIFDSTSNTDCIADVVVDNLASISLNSGYTSTLTLNSDFVGGSNELTLTGDLTVDSGTILCKGDTSTTYGTGIIINAANMTVGENGQISANSQGFPGSQGPGAINHQRSGGSHGGYGGALYASSIYPTPYGSVSQPTVLGSGGGHNSNGGIGGGAIKLVASNIMTINGTISANGGSGQPYDYGGGAGGSIWIITNTLAGSGAITAEGGNGQRNGNDGGGGRISLQWSSGKKTFNGTVSAKSAGRGWATHGTLYVYVPDDPANSWNELWDQDDPVSGSVALAPGVYDIDHLHITNNATLECQGDTTAINEASGGTVGNPHGSGVTINSDNIIIDEGAAISANYSGFIRYQGPGAINHNRSGGSHGGYGGAYYASAIYPTPYGSVSQPTALGSGGGMSNAGGRGGGAIKLVVSDTITINGTVSANGGGGQAYDTGGGAGGSIWVIANTLAGSGAITAEGGNGQRNGNDGGGGRISLQWSSGMRTFDGTISAKSGGRGWATHGTLYVYVPDDPANSWNELWDQDDPVRAPIALAPGVYDIDHLHITNNATLECQGDTTAINEASGGTVGNPHGSGVTINSDNIIIDEGAAISASYLGFIRHEGPGTAQDNRAGGSHGGYGAGGYAYGGSPYGSVSQPTALGSGGGMSNAGGRGGGAIKLVVSNTTTINGTVSANGGGGQAYDTGGGAGGSAWIITDTLAGSGAITADGGGPNRNGEGAGGGRISLQWATGKRSFYGTISTKNGGHTATNGTIWVPPHLWNELWNQYYHIKAPIALAPGEYDIDYLHVTNNATLECQGDTTAINEASGGTAGNPHGSGVTINSDNIIIDEGAAISANYLGFIRRQGPGVQVSGNRAGPGYGGKGGDYGGEVGGPSYGSVSAPTALGSGGGSTGGGSRGGGAIKLVVDDTITINGTVSANADHGHGYDVSGGAGGSIWIITDTLTGSGAMTALGGAPRRNASGGGGGRIAVYFGNSPSSLGPLSQSTSVAGNTAAYPGTVVWSPIGGYTEESTIPETQCAQSADGIVTIAFKVKDPGDEINGTLYNTNHILRNFEYRVDGGDWNAPRHGDSSLCLGGGWPDNSGSSYTAASAFADATEYSFTWNTLDPDLSGIFDDQGVENVQVRFMVRDTVTQHGDTYYIDSLSYVVSDNWEYDNGLDHPAPAPSTDDGDGGGGSGCFIATAAYGSCMEPHVMILKDFRDTYLLPCALGRTFVRTYYKYSPQLAKLISRHEMLKAVVRVSLLPLLAVSYSTLYFGPIVTLTVSVVLLMTSIFLVSFCRRKAPAVQSWSRNK